MNDTVLSVVIPSYNCANYIEDLIKEIQFLKHTEIIVVDDGSTDESFDVQKRLEKNIKNVNFISKKNGGVSSARNRGIEEANGEYIFFVDADDKINVQSLNVIIDEIYNKNTVYDLVFFGLIDRFFVDNKLVRTGDSSLFDKEIGIKEFMGEFGFYLNEMLLYTPCNKFFKRQIILDNKILFSEKHKLGEDVLFNLDYYEFANTIKFYPYNIYYYDHYLERNDTGSTQYVENTEDIYVEVFKKIEDLLHRFDVYDENIKDLHCFIVRRISALMNSVHAENSPLSEIDKYLYFKKIYDNEVYKNAINDKKIVMKTKKDKLLLLLYRYKLTLLIYILYKINNYIKIRGIKK